MEIQAVYLVAQAQTQAQQNEMTTAQLRQALETLLDLRREALLNELAGIEKMRGIHPTTREMRRKLAHMERGQVDVKLSE